MDLIFDFLSPPTVQGEQTKRYVFAFGLITLSIPSIIMIE